MANKRNATPDPIEGEVVSSAPVVTPVDPEGSTEPTTSNTALSSVVASSATQANQHVDPRLAMLTQQFTEAQITFLTQRTPQKEIKQRQGRGGMTFSYVEQGYVTEKLNLVFGFNWDFEVVDKQIIGDNEEVVVEARLTVRTPSGQSIVKTQFGGSDIKKDRNGKILSIADDYKSAASDALKKCASLLGIGLDLYGREGGPMESAPNYEEIKKELVQIGQQHGVGVDIIGRLVTQYIPRANVKFQDLTNEERMLVRERVINAIRQQASEAVAVG